MTDDNHDSHDNGDNRDGYFGTRIAADYDRSSADMFTPEILDPTIDLLAELAGEGPALEFAIGTGRVALPLAARGVDVHGIDLSRAMVDRLRAKPGGAGVPVTIGDFATATAARTDFTLAYLVFNTIGNLTTQDAQVDCFRNAAAHLAPGGRFVIEVGVPDLRRLPYGQDAVPFEVSDTRWAFDRYDVATQAMSSNYVDVDPKTGRASYWTIPFRYVWPAELDLMARIAGLRPTARWDGWTKKPFTSESRGHVSVWEKPA
ncbi:class I SAM-dependent DNA methyltransferase [Streptomyces endophyticus]|uniref:Class I SAM-dependent methyltransferase n=1 Tax=Streptomyces endophyticus TaxID=714166 RepID=A0ABU6EY93_9ACTN|nr:class I SAM-dependent methyltransferase [Streptomyces endophyticus]MEB8336730.1 class I SAM-dependent methyltransferase [Streptomyces endophyticus]